MGWELVVSMKQLEMTEMVSCTWRDGSDLAVLRCALCWKREGSEGHWDFALCWREEQC